MTAMLTVRVQRIRYRSKMGATVSGLAIDGAGLLVAGAPRYGITFPIRVTSVDVQQGQWWRVVGDPQLVEYLDDGFRVVEHRFVAREAQLLRPSGEHIIQLLATSPAFPGMGEVKARRLWENLGEALYDCLDSADHAPLADVVGTALADVLLAGWRQYGNADALRWFHAVGLDLRLSRKLLAVYGDEALAAIAADPYRLLAFGMSWQAVDKVARQHFALRVDDGRRLLAAVEAVLYRAFDAGDTYGERAAVEVALSRLIDRSLVVQALALAESTHCVQASARRIHALGPYLIEQTVAAACAARLHAGAPLTVCAEVDALVAQFEQEEATSLSDPAFALSAAQRLAVLMTTRHPLVLITGGAGVGKTTVLKAVGRMLDHCGQHAYAMALSGRAARRMTEATNRPAMTIAAFLRNVAPAGLPDNSVLVVDEASMLDILFAYRLVKAIPDTCRLILIGDPFQLPPVGPGLTLHALVSVKGIPRVELTEVRRFGGVIAAGAQAVREGRWPAVDTAPNAALAFLHRSDEDIAGTVLKHYLTDPLNTQILTFTREHGAASAKTLNTLCQNALASGTRRLVVWNVDRDRMEDSGLHMGEPVLCTRNLWRYGIQNGSLGRIESIEEIPQPIVDADGEPLGLALAWIRWDDGERRPITVEVLDALELGYAVTVHKAQGSQFKRVIIPVRATRNLDRTMLYTAITRATTQVLLVGDADAARRAIEGLPHAFHRKVGLAEMIEGAH